MEIGEGSFEFTHSNSNSTILQFSDGKFEDGSVVFLFLRGWKTSDAPIRITTTVSKITSNIATITFDEPCNFKVAYYSWLAVDKALVEEGLVQGGTLSFNPEQYEKYKDTSQTIKFKPGYFLPPQVLHGFSSIRRLSSSASISTTLDKISGTEGQIGVSTTDKNAVEITWVSFSPESLPSSLHLHYQHRKLENPPQTSKFGTNIKTSSSPKFQDFYTWYFSSSTPTITWTTQFQASFSYFETCVQKNRVDTWTTVPKMPQAQIASPEHFSAVALQLIDKQVKIPENSGESLILRLPKDIWTLLKQKLGPLEACQLSLTCKSLYQLFGEEVKQRNIEIGFVVLERTIFIGFR